MAKRFYLYQRKRKDKPSTFYVRFRADDGTISSLISTGQSDEKAAESLAVEQLLAGETVKARNPRVLTFKEWAAPWWKFETCPYIREKLALTDSLSARPMRKYAAATLTGTLCRLSAPYRSPRYRPETSVISR